MSSFKRLLVWIVKPLVSVFPPCKVWQQQFIWAKKYGSGSVLNGEAI